MSTSLRVFVCGTQTDLVEEREGVLDAIRKLRLQHDSMEFFGARTDQPIETCLDEVRRSDVLVVVVGHLYGSVVPDRDISFTEAEYEEGRRLGKPCLVYMRHDDVRVLPRYIEQNPEKIVLLKHFKEKLLARHTVARFRDAQDLPLQVAADLSTTAQELRTAAQEGVIEHLTLLNRGVDGWNAWRVKNPKASPDLSGANLSGMNLTAADFRQVNLTDSDLSEATLRWTNLSGAVLRRANLTRALLDETVFANCDLTGATGMVTCRIAAPSTIDERTLRRSGKLPAEFLRVCGVSDFMIDNASIFRSEPLQFYSCFISYSRGDEEFVDRLYADLQDKGVRCWLDRRDLRGGDLLRDAVEGAIRAHDRLLLVLSESSLSSAWVDQEVTTAFEREKREKKTVLFPIRLDETIMAIKSGWPADLRRSRHIRDFTNWNDQDAYQEAFDRLIRDLKQEAEKGDSPQAGLD